MFSKYRFFKPRFTGPHDYGTVFLSGFVFAILVLTGLEAEDTPIPRHLDGTMTVRGSIDLGTALHYQDFAFTVDELTYGVGVEIKDAQVDLDILVLGPRQEEVLRLESGDFNEKFFLHRMGERPLLDGSYTLRVGYYMDEVPRIKGQVLKNADFGVQFHQVTARTAKFLNMGDLKADSLAPAEGMMTCFGLKLQPDQKSLRIDVLDTQADLDFFVFPLGLKGDPFLAPWRARSYRSREYLNMDLGDVKRQFPAWDGKNLWVMVLCRMDEIPSPFSILPSASQGVPLVLAGLPSPSELWGGKAAQGRDEPSPLNRALAATVEIQGESGGGTGCVVSPRGHVITNLHVISGLDGQIEDELAIGFSIDRKQAPDCQFLAKVLQVDREKDLALLQIIKGYYGQELPPGYQFPWLPLGDSRSLEMGDELLFTGYPLLGGLGSRSTITLTRGIVSGYEDRGYGVLVKTDALIAPGNSGGAALDRAGNLVGIPTLVVSDSNSRMAYIHPAEIFPASWLALIALTP